MRVCFFSVYSTKNYIRQKVLLEGLKENNVELLEIREHGKNPLRYVKALWKLILNRKNFDVLLVNFRGHEVMPFLRILTKKPIIFDSFISIHETLCYDIKKIKPNSVIGNFVYWFEKKCLDWSQIVLLDTNEQIKYFIKTFNINKKKFRRVFVGADNLFYPRKKQKSNKFCVLWYGNYIPLQGAEFIIEAAKELKQQKDIYFKLIGNGQTFKKVNKIAEKFNLCNLEFASRVSYSSLPQEIANCDVFLGGHFGKSHKSKSVISGKTYQAMAVRVPLIIGKNPANRELFTDRKDCIMVEHESGKEIAKAILKLKNNPKLREKIKINANELFLKNCVPILIGKEIKKIIEELEAAKWKK